MPLVVVDEAPVAVRPLRECVGDCGEGYVPDLEMPIRGTVPVLQDEVAVMIDCLGVQVWWTATGSQEAPGSRSAEYTSASQLSGSATVPSGVLMVSSSGPIGSSCQSPSAVPGAAGSTTVECAIAQARTTPTVQDRRLAALRRTSISTPLCRVQRGGAATTCVGPPRTAGPNQRLLPRRPHSWGPVTRDGARGPRAPGQPALLGRFGASDAGTWPR
jgi:hypothetical protein